jgi:hypothetical protein
MARTRPASAEDASLWSWRHKILKSWLPPAARHVLLTLACRMSDHNWECFSSVRNLVADTGLPADAVRAGLRDAALEGWIEVTEIETGYMQITRRA